MRRDGGLRQRKILARAPPCTHSTAPRRGVVVRSDSCSAARSRPCWRLVLLADAQTHHLPGCPRALARLVRLECRSSGERLAWRTTQEVFAICANRRVRSGVGYPSSEDGGRDAAFCGTTTSDRTHQESAANSRDSHGQLDVARRFTEPARASMGCGGAAAATAAPLLSAAHVIAQPLTARTSRQESRGHPSRLPGQSCRVAS